MTHSSDWFKHRTVIIATMHQKETAIAPILASHLGVTPQVPPNFNTDVFGTFTREIKRTGNQIEAARLKAQKALEITGATLAIASEGSFFPHPSFPYLSCDREILLLLDQQHNLEIIAQEISTDTNYNHKSIETIQEALDFAEKVGFPEHRLVVMITSHPTDNSTLFKGINTQEQLIESVESALSQSPHGKIHIETDMRAMYNPTRMKTIEKATYKLIEKINQVCPECACPGFDVVESRPGLPCGWCSTPTDLILHNIYICQRCLFREEQPFPNGVETADPAYCPYCNP